MGIESGQEALQAGISTFGIELFSEDRTRVGRAWQIRGRGGNLPTRDDVAELLRSAQQELGKPAVLYQTYVRGSATGFIEEAGSIEGLLVPLEDCLLECWQEQVSYTISEHRLKEEQARRREVAPLEILESNLPPDFDGRIFCFTYATHPSKGEINSFRWNMAVEGRWPTIEDIEPSVEKILAQLGNVPCGLTFRIQTTDIPGVSGAHRIAPDRPLARHILDLWKLQAQYIAD